MKNCTPIAFVNAVDYVMEKVSNSEFVFLNENNILHTHQHDFQIKHNTSDVVLKLRTSFTTISTTILVRSDIYVVFVYVQNCVRVACARSELRMRWWYEYETMNPLLVRRMLTKRNIENPIPGTQIFVKARNNEYKYYNKETKKFFNKCEKLGGFKKI